MRRVANSFLALRVEFGMNQVASRILTSRVGSVLTAWGDNNKGATVLVDIDLVFLDANAGKEPRNLTEKILERDILDALCW